MKARLAPRSPSSFVSSLDLHSLLLHPLLRLLALPSSSETGLLSLRVEKRRKDAVTS